MCTCITYKNDDFYFGRNLDLEYSFGEKVVITPRKYQFNLTNGSIIKDHYAMVGMATVVDNYPLYAEAVNEKGLGIAGLNFPYNAVYNEPVEGKTNIAPFELIPWILSNADSVAKVRNMLKDLNIVNIPFKEDLPLAPLHWMIADEKESIVVESCRQGLMIYDNEYGVLTNNPPFDYHKMNMANYLNLTAVCPENRFAKGLELKVYGQGMGAIGLPGDVSPASRFVRAVFNKHNSVSKKDELDNVSQFFHILDSVSMVRGTTITPEGKYDITTYSCCINGTKGIFYYKTYGNNQITAVKMHKEDLDKESLYVFDLIEKQQINYVND